MKRSVFFLLLIASGVQAQQPALQTSQNVMSHQQPLTLRQQAVIWDVTPEEWQRYLMLKQQARGIWSPGLDPLTTLGVEAETDSERQRFAGLLVKKEFQRLEKELAFQRAYDAAWQRLYPELAPLKTVAAGTTRVSLFVKDNCAACDNVLRTLLAQNRPLDIWLVNSESDDNLVRRWASEHGIDSKRVHDHSITLNHDAGRWLQLGQKKIPVVLERKGEQWYEVLL